MNVNNGVVQGFCSADYEDVIDVFADLFEQSGEQGAAVAVYKGGELKLSLWGGTRDKAETLPWEEQTQVNAFSASKGLTAICALQLVESGALELDKPVAHYWPEFAAADKGNIRVRDVLCHRSGVSAFSTPVADDAIYDWQQITEKVAVQSPWWTPGTEQGYSPMIYGWMVGELIRRVSGADSFGDYFQDRVAQPIGASCQFGVSTAYQPLLADVGPLKLTSFQNKGKQNANDLGRLMKADPRGVVNKAFTNPMSLMMGTNSPAWREAQIPAANGHTSAVALAAIYGALANGGALTRGGARLLSEESLSYCWQEQSRSDNDNVLGVPLRFSLGFMLSGEREDCRFGRGERGFGHPGAGGCLGFADPDYDIGFGYVTNRMGQGLLIDPRANSLVDAIYRIGSV